MRERIAHLRRFGSAAAGTERYRRLLTLLGAALYAFPRTSVLGAILLTGYLGGAVATHVRAADGWFGVFFAVAFGVLLWLGLYLRDARVRALLPLRT